jgi:Family of unknown function (DUF6445)
MTHTGQQSAVQQEAKLGRIGVERAPFVVIDNFVNDPEGLVDFAAAQDTFAPVDFNLYPGVRTAAPETYAREVVLRIEKLVREVFGLQDLQLLGCQCNFSLVTTPPDKLQPMQLVPHFDTTNIHQLAVLHYLCPADRGGTSFYRHRRTGYESITKERRDAYMATLNTEINVAGPQAPAYINGDTTLFERLGSVDAMFNRLLIYRSVNLHSGNIGRDFGFERDVRKGRLTLNTFMQFGPRGYTLG